MAWNTQLWVLPFSRVTHWLRYWSPWPSGLLSFSGLGDTNCWCHVDLACSFCVSNKLPVSGWIHMVSRTWVHHIKWLCVWQVWQVELTAAAETLVIPVAANLLGNAWLLEKKFVWRRRMSKAVIMWFIMLVTNICGDWIRLMSLLRSLDIHPLPLISLMFFYIVKIPKQAFWNQDKPMSISHSLGITLCHSFYVYGLCGGPVPMLTAGFCWGIIVG